MSRRAFLRSGAALIAAASADRLWAGAPAAAHGPEEQAGPGEGRWPVNPFERGPEITETR